MDFKIVPITEKYAREMIDDWKYGEEYSIYDYCNGTEWLLREKLGC